METYPNKWCELDTSRSGCILIVIPTECWYETFGLVESWAFSWQILIHGDQQVSVHLMITIQKITSNVQSVPRGRTWLNLTAWQPTSRAKGTLGSH
jgi:hypothetical protein